MPLAKYGQMQYFGRKLWSSAVSLKILQNAIQTHWPCVNRTHQSKVITKSHSSQLQFSSLATLLAKKKVMSTLPWLTVKNARSICVRNTGEHTAKPGWPRGTLSSMSEIWGWLTKYKSLRSPFFLRSTFLLRSPFLWWSRLCQKCEHGEHDILPFEHPRGKRSLIWLNKYCRPNNNKVKVPNPLEYWTVHQHHSLMK